MPTNVITNLTYTPALFGGQHVTGHHQATVPDYHELGELEARIRNDVERRLNSLEHELYKRVDKILQSVYEENNRLKQEVVNLKNELHYENQRVEKKLTTLIEKKTDS